MRKSGLILAIVLAALPFAARAQTFQFLPEIDAYYKFDPNLRVYFQAKDTREGGAQNSAEIGPSLDFHIKPLEKLRDIAAFDQDESKSQLLLFSVGYRYLPTPGDPPTDRFEPYVIVRLPSPGRAATSLGTIAIALMSKGRGRFAAITCRLMSPPNSGTRASTRNGARHPYSLAACFRLASMSVSTRITSTRTTPASHPTSN